MTVWCWCTTDISTPLEGGIGDSTQAGTLYDSQNTRIRW